MTRDEILALSPEDAYGHINALHGPVIVRGTSDEVFAVQQIMATWECEGECPHKHWMNLASPINGSEWECVFATDGPSFVVGSCHEATGETPLEAVAKAALLAWHGLE